MTLSESYFLSDNRGLHVGSHGTSLCGQVGVVTRQDVFEFRVVMRRFGPKEPEQMLSPYEPRFGEILSEGSLLFEIWWRLGRNTMK